MRRTITSPKAPRAIGPYSPALAHGKWVFISGQIGLNPDTMALVSPDFEAQARQVFDNLNIMLEAADRTTADVMRLTVYLTNLAHASILNAVMETYYQKPYPTRSLIACSELPKGALIEVDAMALDSTPDKPLPKPRD